MQSAEQQRIETMPCEMKGNRVNYEISAVVALWRDKRRKLKPAAKRA
jgi:hypothetical protein